MFYLLLAVIGISFAWELSFAGDSVLTLFQTGSGGAMWGASTLYLYDFQQALRGKSTPYMAEFYSRIKKDLFVCFALGLTLVILFSSVPSTYSFSNVDLAFLGMPFLLYSFSDVLALRHLKIGKASLLRRPIYGLLALLIFGYGLFFFWVREIVSNTYSQSEALWMQITIFATGLYAFIASNFIRFSVEKERFEIFPSIRNTLCITQHGRRMYDELEKAVEQWNSAVEKKKLEDLETERKAAREKKGKLDKKGRRNKR